MIDVGLCYEHENTPDGVFLSFQAESLPEIGHKIEVDGSGERRVFEVVGVIHHLAGESEQASIRCLVKKLSPSNYTLDNV